MGECILSLNACGTKQRWDTIAFFDTTGVEKSKYASSNAKEFKLQDTRLLLGKLRELEVEFLYTAIDNGNNEHSH